ncbi:hypothetical protein L1887_24109 [Cichorium endivia]|nr:hypothetical protein L1887_24109 [Cichorium endivia]
MRMNHRLIVSRSRCEVIGSLERTTPTMAKPNVNLRSFCSLYVTRQFLKSLQRLTNMKGLQAPCSIIGCAGRERLHNQWICGEKGFEERGVNWICGEMGFSINQEFGNPSISIDINWVVIILRQRDKNSRTKVEVNPGQKQKNLFEEDCVSLLRGKNPTSTFYP